MTSHSFFHYEGGGKKRQIFIHSSSLSLFFLPILEGVNLVLTFSHIMPPFIYNNNNNKSSNIYKKPTK